jgi:hypothetical protein
MTQQQTTAINNLHLQLCVNDLLHPTEKSELLLEALTSSQLDDIERTLVKIKERKLSVSPQNGTYNASYIYTQYTKHAFFPL